MKLLKIDRSSSNGWAHLARFQNPWKSSALTRTFVGPVSRLTTSEALISIAFTASSHFLFPLPAFPLAASHAGTFANKPLDLQIESHKIFWLAGSWYGGRSERKEMRRTGYQCNKLTSHDNLECQMLQPIRGHESPNWVRISFNKQTCIQVFPDWKQHG